MKSTLFLVAALALPPAGAATVAYEHLPEVNSTVVSFHTVGGPVVADDFDPLTGTGGWVVFAEWWGSVANSASWEITFHQGGLSGAGFGQPLPIPATTGGTKLFVTSTGTAAGGGLFYYSAAIPVGTFSVIDNPAFGSEYWFSVANAGPGWTWAFAGAGPSVGDEHWAGAQSFGSLTCPDGGPHCGAWNTIPGRDFAFRLSTVPEPATTLLVGVGLVVLGTLHRMRHTR